MTDENQGSNGPEIYPPSAEVIEEATIKEYDETYQYSITNREAFWAEEAERLEWFEKWDKVMDAEDMLFIFYTSGTTGRPKEVVHTHGGYSIYTSATHRMVFDIKEEDRWWRMIE